MGQATRESPAPIVSLVGVRYKLRLKMLATLSLPRLRKL